MSTYTTELRYLCEAAAGLEESEGYQSVEQIVEAAAPSIFDFDFPIFDEDYRLTLEKRILIHFYRREIGYETPGYWKLRLMDKMNLIMPKYNGLYESVKMMMAASNPLNDVDLSTTREKTGEQEKSGVTTSASTDAKTRETGMTETETETNHATGSRETETTGGRTDTSSTTQNSTNNSNATQWNLYSDTPQGGVNALTNDDDSVANNTYLTDARKVTDTASATSSGTASGTFQTSDTGNATEETESNENNNTSLSRNTLDTVSGTGSRSGTSKDTINSTDTYVEHVTGRKGRQSFYKTLMEYREALVNIDEMLMDELEPLFMCIW